MLGKPTVYIKLASKAPGKRSTEIPVSSSNLPAKRPCESESRWFREPSVKTAARTRGTEEHTTESLSLHHFDVRTESKLVTEETITKRSSLHHFGGRKESTLGIEEPTTKRLSQHHFGGWLWAIHRLMARLVQNRDEV